MAAQIGADYHGRFIVELLQNASDQAAKARLEKSDVVIIRTSEVIAITNEGVPFDEDGLRSLPPGLSTKNPSDTIGNKGVGFKSVFQVSEFPEIYSSSAKHQSFEQAPGLMFKLSSNQLCLHSQMWWSAPKALSAPSPPLRRHEHHLRDLGVVEQMLDHAANARWHRTCPRPGRRVRDPSSRRSLPYGGEHHGVDGDVALDGNGSTSSSRWSSSSRASTRSTPSTVLLQMHVTFTGRATQRARRLPVFELLTTPARPRGSKPGLRLRHRRAAGAAARRAEGAAMKTSREVIALAPRRRQPLRRRCGRRLRARGGRRRAGGVSARRAGVVVFVRSGSH